MEKLFAGFIALVITTSAVFGHEFWLAPEKYQLQTDEPITAQLRGGQNFVGGPFSYIPDKFERFELVQGGRVVKITGRIGDRPAVNAAAPGEGLWVIVHETKDSKLTYSDWSKFTGFVEHKDLTGTLAEHLQRGLPETGFRERYRRFVKALVAVGTGQGADTPTGMRTEIVALANPYTDDLAGGMPVQVLFEGAPRVDVQLEVFDRAPSGQITITTQRTDGDGQALVAVTPGHEYLLDAVVMLPLFPADTAKDPVWESLWAGLTFMVPKG